MRPWITVIALVVFWVGTMLLTYKYSKKPKVINYETKYDSLQQQLKLQWISRDIDSHTIDSLNVLVDSLSDVDQKIQVEIREVPGTYNKYNSEELTKKMIESYEQR